MVTAPIQEDIINQAGVSFSGKTTVGGAIEQSQHIAGIVAIELSRLRFIDQIDMQDFQGSSLGSRLRLIG